MASSDPHRSTLTESNLEGTVTLRDRRALVPIPEDRSDGASVDFSRITQQKKSWVLANDDKESVVASSTRGVVDERPEASLPRDGDGLSNASGVQKAPRCRISWKIVAIVLLLGIVGIATVLVIARGALMGGNDDSNQNLRGNSPSVPSPTPPTNADELEELNGVLRSFSGDSLFRPGTAQYKARRWIALEDEARVRVRTHGPDRIRQRYSLAVFYFATSGDQWSDQYLNADHECNWDGISCNSGSVVTSLSYRQAGLNGTIPKEVGKIRGLQDIDFSGNALSRGIPKSLFGSPNIKIVRLSDNQLDGKVGSWIWRSSLREVRLRNNSFRGKLPSVPPSRRRYSLSTIDFRDNNFSGTISESWGKLNSSLVGLYLGGNGLTGSIPEWIYDANRLQHLYIPNTNISGTISEKLWKLPNLQKIVLHNNKLSGSIPGVPITASPKVRGCDLSANFLNGTIPPTLFRLSKLEALVLSNNSLTGTIPEVPIPGIMSLWHIGVGRNSLEGSLPSSLWDLPSLESLDVFWNRLNGTIAFPVGTTSLPLKHFWGQMNDFEGMLPTNWSRLLHLEELLLFGNNFAPQPLPQSLFNLFNLTYLDLSEGAFTGNLPALDNLQMLEKLYLNDNQLQGPLPASLPPLLEDIWLNNNSFSGGIPSLFGANSANLSTVLLHDNRLNGTMATGLCDKALTRLEADCLNSTLPDYVACPSDCCTACF